MMKAIAHSIVLLWLASFAGCYSSDRQPSDDTVSVVENAIGRPLARDVVVLWRSKEEDTRDHTFLVLHGKNRVIPPDQNTVEIPGEDAYASLLDFLDDTSAVGEPLQDTAYFTALEVPSGCATAVQLETEQGWYLILEIPKETLTGPKGQKTRTKKGIAPRSLVEGED